MSKWQIICPLVAICLASIIVGSIHLHGERRSFLLVASQRIGQDLIDYTNSTHLVRVGPQLRKTLDALLAARTRIASVNLGDETYPFGDGRAVSHLVLSNEVGQSLSVRLRPLDHRKFEILGFRILSH